MNMYYQETKGKLDEIREKYSSTGDIIFRSAIQIMMAFGQDNLRNDAWFNSMLASSATHIERSLLYCAREISELEPFSIITYLGREIYFGGDGISYKRAIKLLVGAINAIEDINHESTESTLADLHWAGFKDAEIEELGFGYLFDMEDEE